MFQTKRNNDFVQKVNLTFSGDEKSGNSVSRQLPPEENCTLVRVVVWVKVRVSFMVEDQPDNCVRGKLPLVRIRV